MTISDTPPESAVAATAALEDDQERARTYRAQLADTWTVDAALGTPRAGHTATLLPSGQVLVVGGMDMNGAIIGSAETGIFYRPVA